ncbi:szy-20 [Pristionchus pacificus]|uniref:Szy-20 n=1 Tax=Pristionchus pacificus TaxID=54126 RepID=A0A2A6CYZ7_PRIPA|nr:szy-20 [Pristionchus pacificus]|eukprot:PDM83389.1 szy-20 [Pristionchus pacificus]
MSMAVTESTGSFTRLFIVPYFIDLALNKINPSIDYSSRPYLEASSSAVADDWETGEAQQEEQLKNKQQQIRILKREKENREAAKQEQFSLSLGGHAPAPVITAVPADAKPIPAAPRKLLRRPASGPNMPAAAAAVSTVAEATDVAVTVEPRAEEGETGADIPVHEEEKFKNLEKRKAVYDAARSRILGTDYKPEEVKAPVNTSCRSRSPEIELKQRMTMSGGGPSPMGPPLPMSIINPDFARQVNFSEPPPPLPPAHLMAAYQQHIMMTQQQQQPYGYSQPPQYPPMGMQMGAAPTVPTTSSNQGYRDLFDTQPLFSSLPPLTSLSGTGEQTRGLSSMAIPSLLPSNGMMYSAPPPSLGVYGRPPPSLFQTQNPDITFRHEASRGGRRRKN